MGRKKICCCHHILEEEAPVCGVALRVVAPVRAEMTFCSDHPGSPARATKHQGGKESGSGPR